ncbi:MAG: peptidoglycan-binding protein [bacterium]|nr:peptidoglycan-binding protein [bacterium]
MKLRHISAAVAIAVLLPFAASALTVDDIQQQITNLLSQIKQLQEQLKSLQTPPSTDPIPVINPMPGIRPCPQILRTLNQGVSGSDVSELQTYLGVSATGYFGPMTANAVSQFQSSEGLAQVGMVGPQTRAAFARRCGGTKPVSNFSASPMSGAAPLYVTFKYPYFGMGGLLVEFGDGTSGYMQRNGQTCIGVVGADCLVSSFSEATPVFIGHTYTSSGTFTARLFQVSDAVPTDGSPIARRLMGTVIIQVGGPTSSSAPSISGIDAPSSLNVGQTGTWTVHASTAGGNLSYSVIWGDEQIFDQINAYAGVSRSVQTSGTFTHAYASARTYKPVFTVSNDSGSAQTSASVAIGGTTGGSSFSAYPTSGTAPLTVQFSATNIDTAWNTYTLNYGDGSQITIGGCGNNAPCYNYHNGSHTYTSAGTYTATLVKPAPAGTRMPDMLLGTVTITVTGSTANGTFVPSASCKAWYDGCNSCFRSVPGGTGGCTKMACQSYSGGYCKENF